jgi:hypothetical protein
MINMVDSCWGSWAGPARATPELEPAPGFEPATQALVTPPKSNQLRLLFSSNAQFTLNSIC